MEPKHLFLSGIGRSGTTAFRRSLGQHPQLEYNGMENNVIQDLLEVAQFNCSQPSRQLQMVINRSEYLNAFAELVRKLHWPQYTETLPLEPLWLTAAINLPMHLGELLFEIFPNSRLICLVRHGVAVVSSRMRYAAFAADSFEKHCQIWLRGAETALWASEQPMRCRVFRQEWMADPEILKRELSLLFAWLDLSAEPAVRNHFLKKRFHATVDSETKPANVSYAKFTTEDRETFENQRLDRWLTWTEQQRTTFTKICGDAMQRLQYPIPWVEIGC